MEPSESSTGTTPFVQPASEIVPLRIGTLRAVLLNRPKALNALNLNMMKQIFSYLQEFDMDTLGKSLMINKYGDCKAFSAGGDTKAGAMYLSSGDEEGKAKTYEMLTTLNKTCHTIATLDTPLTVIMNGITMGGGLSLAAHAPIRVATENTSIWIPEGRIGLYPDAGVGWFLARNIDGPAVGTYLALTGKKLNGMEAVLSGFATHFVPQDRLIAMVDALADLKTTDLRVIDAVIEDFVGNAPSVEEWNNWSISGDVRNNIDRCFNSRSLTTIVSTLAAEKSAFASDALRQMQIQSPIALRVTAELLHRARTMDFASYMKLEQRLGWYFVYHFKDFAIGTVATRLHKIEKPAWSPSWEAIIKGEEVSDNDMKVIFGDDDAKPSDKIPQAPTDYHLPNSKSFKHYTHRTAVSIPSEDDVRRIVTGDASGAGSFAFTKQELLDWFADNWGTFLDDEHLTPISVMDPRLGGMRYMDPNYYEGVSDAGQVMDVGGRRKREKWAVRQRVEAVVERRCDEKEYLKWKSSK